MAGVITYYIMMAFEWGIRLIKALFVISILLVAVLVIDEIIHRLKK